MRYNSKTKSTKVHLWPWKLHQGHICAFQNLALIEDYNHLQIICKFGSRSSNTFRVMIWKPNSLKLTCDPGKWVTRSYICKSLLAFIEDYNRAQFGIPTGITSRLMICNPNVLRLTCDLENWVKVTHMQSSFSPYKGLYHVKFGSPSTKMSWVMI